MTGFFSEEITDDFVSRSKNVSSCIKMHQSACPKLLFQMIYSKYLSTTKENNMPLFRDDFNLFFVNGYK